MYGKLFVQMYDGTLASKGPWEALVTLQQLVIICDKEGLVDMTVEAISRKTTIPLPIIRKGIEALEKADPESRTPDEDGRRIVRLDDHRAWGWRIVNYMKYRRMFRQEDRREYMKGYMREYRSGEKPEKTGLEGGDVNTSKLGKQKLAQLADSIPSLFSSKTKKNARAQRVSMPDDFGLSERVIDWAKAKGYGRLLEHLEHFRIKCVANGYAYADWDMAFMGAIRQDWAGLRKVGAPGSDRDADGNRKLSV